MKILLTGAAGQLGQCLQARVGPAHTLLAYTSRQLDVSNEMAVMQTIDAQRPHVIINAAAYNAVDRAEHDTHTAYAVNANGPAYLAKVARRFGARLLHISTDYVFSGDLRRPYTENDPTNPLNVYGESKRQGELAALNENPSAIIVRSAWLYSEYGTNFVKTMLRVAQQNQPIRVVNDQFGTPTYAGDLADVLIKIAETGAKIMAAGIYHYSGDAVMTWYELARAVLDYADELAPAKRAQLLVPVSTTDYAADAQRPPYSALACGKISGLGFRSGSTMHNLRAVVERIVAQAPAAIWPKMVG